MCYQISLEILHAIPMLIPVVILSQIIVSFLSKSYFQSELSQPNNNHNRDLQDQFLRFEIKTKTEQVQSQQARPRLKRYGLNKRDRDSHSRIFETETQTRKMVETESLVYLWFNPILAIRTSTFHTK